MHVISLIEFSKDNITVIYSYTMNYNQKRTEPNHFISGKRIAFHQYCTLPTYDECDTKHNMYGVENRFASAVQCVSSFHCFNLMCKNRYTHNTYVLYMRHFCLYTNTVIEISHSKLYLHFKYRLGLECIMWGLRLFEECSLLQQSNISLPR